MLHTIFFIEQRTVRGSIKSGLGANTVPLNLI